MREHIIPANPTVLNPDSNDEIIIKFNSDMDKYRGITEFCYDLKCSIHSHNAKSDEYFINKHMLERLEQLNIKFRVIAPE